jgi:phytoene dehydrogenase-like protein
VFVREAQETIGGGCRSAELTLPGFVHDVCSAIHPLAAASPFFRSLPLADFGLELVESPAALAHPLDDGSAVVVERSLEETAERLGADGAAYRRLLGASTSSWPELETDVLGPLVRLPRHPFLLARFGLDALRSARSLAEKTFAGEPGRAMFAGVGAHSILRLEQPLSASFGLVLLTPAGRFHAAARSGSSTRSSPTCARSAARSRRARRLRRCASCPPPATSCST